MSWLMNISGTGTICTGGCTRTGRITCCSCMTLPILSMSNAAEITAKKYKRKNPPAMCFWKKIFFCIKSVFSFNRP